MTPSISAVVNTRNAERYLDLVLRSVVSWTDEIVVVDMASEDRTLEIARSHGARTIDYPPAGFVEPARAMAVSEARNEWVVIVDADELIPRKLSDELVRTAKEDVADVVYIPRRNYIAGGPLSHTGWGPDQDLQPRFFRKGRLVFSDVIHSQPAPAPGARVRQLRSTNDLAIAHFNYVDFADFVDRLNRYTDIEAAALPADGRRSPVGIVAGLREFIWRYVVKRGYRDGWRGFYLSSLMFLYRFLSHAKAREMRANGDRAAVEESYRREAESLLREYS